MTLAEVEARLVNLEKAVERLFRRSPPTPEEQPHWWRDAAGRFADDPVFEEIVRLGRKYRKSLRPTKKSAKTTGAKNDADS